ncbi:hypothetical protein ADUPG1_012420, partial [Aduncisulcus paluster]
MIQCITDELQSPSDVVDGTYGDYSSLILFESLNDVLPLLDDDTIDTNTSITNKWSICYGLTPQLCSTMLILDLSILADGSIFFVTSRGLVVGKSLINFAKTIQSMVFYPLTATGHYTLNKRELIYGWNEIDLDTGLNFFPRVYVHSNFKCSVDGCADTILYEDSEEIDGFWSGDTSEVSSLANLSLSQAATLFGSRYVTISLQRSNGGSVDFSIGDLRPVWVTPEEDVQPASWVVQIDPASLVDPLLLDVYFLQDNAVADSGIYDYDYAIYLSPFSSFSIPVISATIPDDGIMAVTSSTTNNLYIITGVKDDSSVANALLQCNLTYISSFPVSSFLTSSSYGFSDSNAWEVVSTGEIYDARSIHLNRDGVGVTIVGSKVYSGYLTGEHMDMTSLSSTSDDPVIKIQQEPLSNVPVVESVRYREGGGGSYGGLELTSSLQISIKQEGDMFLGSYSDDGKAILIGYVHPEVYSSLFPDDEIVEPSNGSMTLVPYISIESEHGIVKMLRVPSDSISWNYLYSDAESTGKPGSFFVPTMSLYSSIHAVTAPDTFTHSDTASLL